MKQVYCQNKNNKMESNNQPLNKLKSTSQNTDIAEETIIYPLPQVISAIDGEPEEEENEDEEDETYTAGVRNKVDDKQRPGPRRKSCQWCNNRKCTHCRCESFSRCDHSNNEQCKR